MCGRFIIKTDLEHIQLAFNIDQANTGIKPSYNVAPSQLVVTVVQRDDARMLDAMQWGFQPSWAKDKGIRPMINARAETVSTNGLFKHAFQSRRCLIVGDGFYEWQKTGKVKTPMFIRLKSDEPFGFAGIYTVSKSETESPLVTCAIITTEPNELMRSIHNRMPVILPPKAYDRWLDPSNQDIEKLAALLKPYPASQMQAWEVTKQVNKPENNSPDLIQRLAA
jgi:putative SOS response-associated peptidase YedK